MQVGDVVDRRGGSDGREVLGEAGAELALDDLGNDLAGGGALEACGGVEVGDEFAVIGVNGAKKNFAAGTFWIGTGHGVRFLGDVRLSV